MNATMQSEETLTSAWAQFELLNGHLTRYLKSSENEFGALIQALGDCWTLAENVQSATVRLSEVTEAAGVSQAAIHQSMLEGCGVLAKSVQHIQVVSRQLTSNARETQRLLEISNNLQEKLAQLRYLAFHFRLEGSRLSSDEGSFILDIYKEVRDVVSYLKRAGDSQQSALTIVLTKILDATKTVEQASAPFALRANEAEKIVKQNLAQLSIVPRDLLRLQNKADTLGTLLSNGVRDAVKALQGHDAIRQRLEHVLQTLGNLRDDEEQQNDPGHTLLIQRMQAKAVVELIIEAGNSIKEQLNCVIGCALGIVGDGTGRSSADDDVNNFENSADRLSVLSVEVAELLAADAKMGAFVADQISPIRELLGANSLELEVVARAMRRLAFNVLIDANKMPSAAGIGVLGGWTAEISEGILTLSTDLNQQFVQLAAKLHSLVEEIASDGQNVELSRSSLVAQPVTSHLRNSRRIQYDEINRLCEGANQLHETTHSLVQSLKFIDEGTKPLGDLDSVLDLLLSLYPKSDRPFDIDSSSAGYTSQEQHDVHALAFGGPLSNDESRTEPTEGHELGANVELF
jgi:hypothetical protein